MNAIAINTTYSEIEDAAQLTKMMAKLEQYINNRALDKMSLTSLVIAYAILILMGTLGNGLVCVAVARKPKMRTSRNLFIMNLAISDLLLCLFTTPFSLVEISTKFWPFDVTMCKLVLALEATSIFVSTISITAIAFNNYKWIFDSGRENIGLSSILQLVSIWTIALTLASPLFLFRTVETHQLGMPWLESVNFCVERWPIPHGRGYYSLFSMVFQNFIIIVPVVCICCTSTTQVPNGTQMKSSLLISIVLISCISWLPLNLVNFVADFRFPFKSDHTFRIVFALCHMAGLSSACLNPLLYGWLNHDFRNEFKDLSRGFQSFLVNCFTSKISTNNSTIHKSQSDRRPSHTNLVLNTQFGDDDKYDVHIKGKSRETPIDANSLNDKPLEVSCEN